MKTTATNRKIRTIINDLVEDKLVPNPTFQRRLVWTSAHKLAFLETVLLKLPFPEIYIAAGEIDPETAEGKEMLVDGQQRITTIFQYFKGSVDVKYNLIVPPYETLTLDQKRDFLEYEVVVRDLGSVDIESIKDVFRRINSTKYSLNAMEMQNARYEGVFKEFGDKLAQHKFFEQHGIFTSADIRRMHDIRFALTLAATMLSGYFNRDAALEEFLRNYSDEFPQAESIMQRLDTVFGFINGCQFSDDIRLWNKADAFTLIVELDRALNIENRVVNVDQTANKLKAFYKEIDNSEARRTDAVAAQYFDAAVQATNDKLSRITRGEIIGSMLVDE